MKVNAGDVLIHVVQLRMTESQPDYNFVDFAELI